MEEKIPLRYQDSQIEVKVPRNNFLYAIKPEDVPILKDEKKSIRESLQNPINCAPLSEQVKKGMKVVIIGDDITRPTPRERIFPILLDELNRAGVPDKDITVIISLGTHRYMSDEEILKCYGKEVVQRVLVMNHEWKDEGKLVKVGSTPGGIPVSVNKIAYEADYLMAVGSVVPHCLAGYGGGGKAVQPGICSWETTGKTHLLPMEKDKFLKLAGDTDNEVRIEMEKVAEVVGLNFICNVVLNEKKEIVHITSGDQVKAHREAVKVAKKVYERKIPALADIVIVSAYPADIDYWQGAKPLSYSQQGLKKRGTTIFLAHLPDGISPTHCELGEHALKSYKELKKLIKENRLEDLVCASTLLQHAKIMEHSSQVICISEGLSLEDKQKLGFKHAETVEEALDMAFKKQGKDAKVGTIDYGGDVLPILES
ncbi:nickel-dependent lactate racemase [Candidatus Aerophobetes bacterium]|nr:nickel-dependent lactate racemase [Candidatus Aerophobetes bacterium]